MKEHRLWAPPADAQGALVMEADVSPVGVLSCTQGHLLLGQEPVRWLEAAILEAVNAQTMFLISGDAEEFLEVVNPEEVTRNCSGADGVVSEEPGVLLGLQVAKPCLWDVQALSAGPDRSQKSRQAQRNKKCREKPSPGRTT